MAQNGICLQLGESAGSPLRWWREGEVEPHLAESAEALADACAGEAVQLLAPATTMVTLQAPMPAMPAQRLRQALPYALEEQFAGDVEQMHFAHGPRDEAGNVPVVVVEDLLIQQWLALCEQAQLRPQGLYHEALSLPWSEGRWTLLLESERALLRTGAATGYALPGEQLGTLLQLAWEQRDPTTVEGVDIYDARGGEEPPLPTLTGAVVEQHRCESPLALLCRGCAQNPIDLMQGPYSRREKIGRFWAPWRATAVLLGLWLGLQAGLGIYGYLRLSGQDAELYSRTESIFRDAFPEVKNVVNPRVQMERRLQSLRSGGGSSPFTRLMTGMGQALKESDGVNLQGLRYRQGQLELELELDTLPQLDSLKAALEAEQLAVEVRSASARGERVEASLILSGGAL
ncbi:MAG: type II secretion system protein GspL [Pseudomonadota bacterium]